jgi:hypothetical protein
MFEEAALATTHESDIHVVDCAEVCMMREIAEVDTDPNSLPWIERVNDPEGARFIGLNDDKVWELKLKPRDKNPGCNPTVTTEFSRWKSKPMNDLQLALESEIQSELSQLERRNLIDIVPTSVPKLMPDTVEIKEPVEGKFFWFSARRPAPIKIGAS